jgi:hypothetical protein
MSRLATVIITVCVAVSFVVASGGAAPKAASPDRLTPYGLAVWNLDALLHDTFVGSDTFQGIKVYRNARISWPKTPANFSRTFINNAHSAEYLFTFGGATGSDFRAAHPSKPPKAVIGASGGEVPLTIRGAYISCGAGTWLFEHYGNGPANWQISCNR